MLVTLGFLSALLVGLVVVPAYRRRIVKLTTNRIKQAIPLTEAEIRADKDRLRADYAIAIHELNSTLDSRQLEVARQRVEINRRDAAISALEGEAALMRTALEEHDNARRVLEHTIMDRMPKVELRLSEARRLLTQRDRELAKISSSSKKQSAALDEATQINAQNRDEIHRLNAALATRAARSREGGAGPGNRQFDAEVALRSEIEALRTKTQDQSALIARLQGLLERAGGAVVGASTSGAVAKRSTRGGASADGAGAGSGASGAGPLGLLRSESEITRLRQNLSEAESVLRSVRSKAEESEASQTSLEDEIRVVKAQNEDQMGEIARLQAALKAYEDLESDARAIPDSKASMKARISQLTALKEDNAVVISKLRAEVAASNEKLARQAAHFRDEMRRLGAGSMPMSSVAAQRGRGGAGTGRDAAGDVPASRGRFATGGRRALSDRITDPRQRDAAGAGAVADAASVSPAAAEAKPAVSNGSGGGNGEVSDAAAGKATGGDAKVVAAAVAADGSDGKTAAEPAAKSRSSRRRGGLLDRITRLDGTK